MGNKGRERRKYIRVRESLLVSYTAIDAEQRHHVSVSKNLSGQGVRLPLKEKLKVGTLLRLQLELLKEKQKIQLGAKVVWVRPNPQDKVFPYEAGLELINISLAKRTMLSNYLQYLKREQLPKEVEGGED